MEKYGNEYWGQLLREYKMAFTYLRSQEFWEKQINNKDRKRYLQRFIDVLNKINDENQCKVSVTPFMLARGTTCKKSYRMKFNSRVKRKDKRLDTVSHEWAHWVEKEERSYQTCFLFNYYNYKYQTSEINARDFAKKFLEINKIKIEDNTFDKIFKKVDDVLCNVTKHLTPNSPAAKMAIGYAYLIGCACYANSFLNNLTAGSIPPLNETLRTAYGALVMYFVASKDYLGPANASIKDRLRAAEKDNAAPYKKAAQGANEPPNEILKFIRQV